MPHNVKPEDIFQKMRRILAEKLKLREVDISKESRLIDDIGIDSVDFWEIIAKVEQEFDISVKDEDVKNAITVDDVVNVLSGKLERSSKKERD